MGGGDDADYPLIDRNNLYYSPFQTGGRNIDIKPSCVNGTIRGNYSAGGTAMSIYCVTTSVTGNFFAGKTFTDIAYPNNTYSSTRPSGVQVMVRPNQYEKGRANITIFNWNLQSSVPVDLSAAGLPSGAAFEIRDAQDFFGAPVVSGTYTGSPVSIPMTGLRVVPPVGRIPIVPTHTAPEFGAFILVPKTPVAPGGGAPQAPPTASLTVSPSSITAGQSALLSWSTSGATGVTIDGGIGSVPASGSASVSPSTTTTYTLVANNDAGTVSKTATVTVGGGTTNQPPAVSLAVAGASTGFQAPASITLTANASDSDGVTGVKFYSGSTLLATDTTNTYSYVWSNVPAGSYTLTAVATDAKGATTTSAPVPVTVAPSGATSGKAAFVNIDTTTHGNWKGVYGSDGYTLAYDATALPAYAKVTTNGQPWIWNKNTTETRALQRAADGRIAAMWFGEVTVIDLTISDGQTHPVALYMLDWEGGRTQSVEVLDGATNTVLDSRTVTNFTQGQYYIWQISGKVRFKISRLGRFNSTHSAIFFGAGGAGGDGTTPPSSPPPPPPSTSSLATFVKTDTSTQGSWKGVYGRDGYSVALDATAMPAYARVQTNGELYSWNRDSAELRATQRAGTGRVASMWWGEDFVVDVAITDGQAHQVALYLLDWQGGRTQAIDVLDPATNSLIGTWTASNFTQGQYWVWKVSGNVRFRIKRQGRYNGVFSGIFFN
jgi:hypothetical protein